MLPPLTTYLAAVVSLLIATVVVGGSAATYTNHTVGGAAGWFFNVTTNTTSANYSTWAAAQPSFNLGDFLIFNTNTNHTVIQTYNATTYDSCTADDASDSDTLIFGSGGAAFGEPQTIAVALTKVDTNDFFSNANDGVQCQHGMRFSIKVGEGSGLPPSLNQPPPPPYSPPPVAESPPAFQGTGGGQGERIHNGCGTPTGVTFARLTTLVMGLGLGLGLLN